MGAGLKNMKRSGYEYPVEWRTWTGVNPVECDEHLVELVRQVKNRCDLFLYVCNIPDLKHTLATILEDMHEDSQAIMHDYCVVEGEASR